jgi:hypothetical protein
LKPCPYCATPLEDAALQCTNCGRWLDPQLDATLNADSAPLVLPPRTMNGLAIGSLACAIFAIGPGSIAAIILGILALRQIRRDPLRLRGKTMAKAGIILGTMGIVVAAVIMFVTIYLGRKLNAFPKPDTQEASLAILAPPSLPTFNLPPAREQRDARESVSRALAL